MRLHPARARAPAAALAVIALALAWAGPVLAQAIKPAPVVAPSRQSGPATIDAEHIEGVGGQEVTATGNAELRQDDTVIFGDYLHYNQEFGRIEADGGVRLEQGGDRFSGPRLRYDSRNQTGVFEQPSFVLRRGEQPARGKAETIEFLGPEHYSMKNGSFTSCEAGREDWRFDAKELELNYNTERGTMRGAKLSFLDLTTPAIPWISFPLENQRKSGFLAPVYAHSSRGGLELAAPVYWNISPEKDATFTPHLISRRGLQLQSEFRYIDRGYFGEGRFEILPEDKAAGLTRSAFSLVHRETFSPNLSGYLNINRVSDDRYFVDLSSRVTQTSTGNLPREGFLQYNGSLGGTGYSLQGLVQRFQTLQDPLNPVVSPYHRVPQITFSASRNDIAGIGDLAFPAEYVRFGHSSLVQGQRVVMNPTFTAPVVAPGYFVTPKAGLHFAGYNLQNADIGTPDRQTITIPWFSVDSGLVYERGVSLAGQNFTQTLEPRLYYVRIPFRDQSRIPLFDTGLADFNYAQIFSENRFVGGDRFGDANQLTAALTTRLLAASSGQELLRATIGQRFYLKDEEVGLTPTSELRTFGSSDLLAAVGGRISQAWSFDTGYEYNGRLARTERFNAAMRYAPELTKVLNLGYRFTRDALQQIDISAQWPVRPGWYGIGRYNYSIKDGLLLSGVGGLEHNAGCWILRIIAQRLQAATQIATTSIFVQIELGDFARLGSDPREVLNRAVPGYTSTRLRPDQTVPASLQPRLPFEQVY